MDKDKEVDIGRAWKDEEYRNSLTPEQLAQIPSNPAGDVEMSQEDLDDIAGGVISPTQKIFRPPYTNTCRCSVA